MIEFALVIMMSLREVEITKGFKTLEACEAAKQKIIVNLPDDSDYRRYVRLTCIKVE